MESKVIQFEYADRILMADVEITYIHEPNYGADADGNRGTPMTWVDEINVISIWDSDTGVTVLKDNDLEYEIQLMVENSC